MTETSTYRINKRTLEEAQVFIDSGVFIDITKMINYCMVFLLDHIVKYDIKGVNHIPRENAVSKACRLNEVVMQRLEATGFFNRKEVPEYALRFYLDWRKSKE